MTTIGRSLVITGEMTGQEDVHIEGRVNGQVLLRQATVTVGEHAHLEADVRGSRVVVSGRVHGMISASERIELSATARVDGSLSANRVVIADGAQFNGGIDMDRRTIASKVAQFKAEQAAGQPKAEQAVG
jgi:cytoskeletal protein CcmA (bactofilin family)